MKNLKKIIPIMTLLLLASNAIAKTRIIYQRFGYGQYYNEWGYYNNRRTTNRIKYVYPYGYYPYITDEHKTRRTRAGYGINSGLTLNNEFLLIEKDDDNLKERVDRLDLAGQYNQNKITKITKEVIEAKDRIDKLDLQAEHNRRNVENLKKEVEENKKNTDNEIKKQQEEIKKTKDDLTQKIEENKIKQEETNQSLSAGIATSIAMASIPQVSEGRLFSIGFGGAYYNKQGGFAIGISGTENSRRVVYKVTAGINTKKEFAAGAGFNINFGTTTSRAMVSPSINVEDQSESKNKIKELQEQINELKKIVEELKRKVK